MAQSSGDGEMSKKIGFWSVLWSVAAAFFGVQSSKNRERDFKDGRPIHFIFVGILLTAVFIAVVWATVNWFIAHATT